MCIQVKVMVVLLHPQEKKITKRLPFPVHKSQCSASLLLFLRNKKWLWSSAKLRLYTGAKHWHWLEELRTGAFCFSRHVLSYLLHCCPVVPFPIPSCHQGLWSTGLRIWALKTHCLVDELHVVNLHEISELLHENRIQQLLEVLNCLSN